MALLEILNDKNLSSLKKAGVFVCVFWIALLSCDSPALGQTVPYGLNVDNITATTFRVSWGGPTGASKYLLDVSSSPTWSSTSWVLHDQDVSSSATSYSVGGLDPSTNYYVRMRAVFSSSGVSGYSATIFPQTLTAPPPAPPTPTATVNINYGCGGNSFVQTNPLTGTESYEWYWQTESNGTSTLYGGRSYGIYSSVNTSKPVFLRARMKASPNTWSLGSQSFGDIAIYATAPNVPTVANNAYGFLNSSVTLSIGAVSGATSYKWYDVASGGTAIDGVTTSFYTISSLTSSLAKTYYVSALAGACETESRLPVSATLVIPNIVVVGGGNPSIAMGSSITLGVDAAYDHYQWRDGNNQTIGSDSPTLLVTQPGKYTVTVTKGNMAGSGTSPAFQVFSGAMGQNQNYIINRTVNVSNIITSAAVDALPILSVNESIQYFDGLGRLMQSVNTQTSPAFKDLVHPVIYDAFGRESKKYLPTQTGASDGWFKHVTFDANGNYIEASANTYGNNPSGKIAQDTRPFAETIFEPSPLNRVLKQGAPGEVWQPNANPDLDKSIKTEYGFNQVNEVLLLEYDELTDKINTEELTYYEPYQLIANKTLDEHNNESIEFIDKEGKIVLKKIQYVKEDGVILYAETYYVYDDFGNIIAVLPPEAIKSIKNQN